MGIRSFLAFELPAIIENNILEILTDLREARLNIRWIKPVNIHLTVLFMGNIKSEWVMEIENEVDDMINNFEPFDISINGLGVFPNFRRPSVFWVGLDGDIERMGLLRDELQIRLSKFGIKEEKRTFKPHLTIGRFRKPGKHESQLKEIISQYEDIRSPVCTLDELILFKSDLKPKGAEYTKLHSWKL